MTAVMQVRQPKTGRPVCESAQQLSDAGLTIQLLERNSAQPIFRPNDPVGSLISNPAHNIGVRCGAESGGLLVRTFYSVSEYDVCVSEHPELASLPTTKTHQGRDVWLIDTEGQTGTVRFDVGGKLRGDGQFAIAPPSEVNSTEVEWIIEPDWDSAQPIPTVRLDQSGLLPTFQVSAAETDPVLRPTEAQPDLRTQKGVHSAQYISTTESEQFCTLVGGSIWSLATTLKIELGDEAVDHEDRIFDLWWETNGSTCDLDEEEARWDFSHMVGYARGGRPFVDQFRDDWDPDAPLPEWILMVTNKKRGKVAERVARAVVLADEIQEGQPFFFSHRMIRRLVGGKPTSFVGVMNYLVRIGVLQLVKPADKRKRKAPIYRLLVDFDGRTRGEA